jgi:hypothetical protein
MLVITLFQDTPSILVALSDVSTDPPREVHERVLSALQAAGYEDVPSSFAVVAAGPMDLVICEIVTTSLADLALEKGGNESKAIEEFAVDLDAVGVWAPVIAEPLATLVESLEEAAVGAPEDEPTAAGEVTP